MRRGRANGSIFVATIAAPFAGSVRRGGAGVAAEDEKATRIP
jgi:hypothetical protein